MQEDSEAISLTINPVRVVCTETPELVEVAPAAAESIPDQATKVCEVHGRIVQKPNAPEAPDLEPLAGTASPTEAVGSLPTEEPPAPTYKDVLWHHLKGTLSCAFMMTCYSLLVFFPAMMACPWEMPQTFWAYNVSEIAFNAFRYTLSLSSVLGLACSLSMLVVVLMDTRIGKLKKGRALNAGSVTVVPMNAGLAFELCMAAAKNYRLQRAHESEGILSIQVTNSTYVDIKIESLDENTSRIHLKPVYEDRLPVLFFKQELHDLLMRTFAQQSQVLTEVEKFIKEHQGVYAEREPLSEYRTHVNYETSRKSFKHSYALVAWAAIAFPLMMYWSAGHGVGNLARHARYEAPVNPAAAVALYTQALSRGPDFDLLLERGELYLTKLDKFNDAETDFQNAMTMDPDSRFAIYGLQSALIQQNRIEEMIRYDDLIAARFPDTADVLNNRAWDEAITGNPAQAIVDANRSIWLDPNFYASYGTRGYAYHLLGNEQQAIADYSTAISLNPADRVDHHLRAQSLRNIGQYGLAGEDAALAQQLGYRRPDLAVPTPYSDAGDPPILPE